MKIKITKTDFFENGGKLYLSYLENISSWESNNEGPSLFRKNGTPSPKMKLKKSGKRNAKSIKLFNSKFDTMRNLKLLTDQIVAKILSDSGISLDAKSMEVARKKIQKQFISIDSVKQNFDVEIELDSETGDCTLFLEKGSENSAEEKPKLELDQSMEFDVEPESAEAKRATESECKENGGQILEATYTDLSEATDNQGETISNGSKAEESVPSSPSRPSEDFQPKSSEENGSKTEEDFEMKPESLPEPKSEDENIKNVPMMGQSSPYSPSKLSDCLKNEVVHKSPNLDFKEEITTKISDEPKPSWTSFLDGVKSVPSSPSRPCEDSQPKSSEENNKKQSNIEGTAESSREDSVKTKIETKEKMEVDQMEKSPGSDSLEQPSIRHDVFLPEDASEDVSATDQVKE